MTDVPSNLVVTYHGVTWKTHGQGVLRFHEPDVNLVCLFDRLPDDTLLYDVTWYVDDTEILTHQTVTSNTSDLALLKGTQILAKGKKANSMVTHLFCCFLFQINTLFLEYILSDIHLDMYFSCNGRYHCICINTKY